MWLIGFCLWPAAVWAADANVNVQVCPATPYPSPSITSPANGTTTTESSVLMTGQATADAPVHAYRNDVEVGFATAGNDGTFAISVSLDIGTNTLKASVNNECTTPAFSNTVAVQREVASAPPASQPQIPDSQDEANPSAPTTTDDQQLDDPHTAQPEDQPTDVDEEPSDDQFGTPIILEPRDGAHFTEPFILLEGEAAPRTYIRLIRNGQQVAEVLTDDKGRFTVGVTLEVGANHLVIETGQGENARSSKEVVVTYEPLPDKPERGIHIAALIVAGVIGGILLAILLVRLHLLRQVWKMLRLRKRKK